MKLYVPIALILCLLTLPSCGDDLCNRASDKMNECSEQPMLEDFLCWAIRACMDCRSEGRTYAKCVVEINSCAELENSCSAEIQEWYSCMEEKGC